jgi:glycosyltransferase involved in cell wall biosynthesis
MGCESKEDTWSRDERGPVVAMMTWGDVWDDFMDSVGVSLDQFVHQWTGGWMFNYIEALQQNGVHVVLMCISARVSVSTHYTHMPTGATICMLPSPRPYQFIRRHMISADSKGGTHPGLWPARFYCRLLNGLAREFRLYLTTPVISLSRELRRHSCTAILCQEYEYPRFDVSVVVGYVLRLPVFAVFQGGDYQRCRLERVLRPRTLRAAAGVIIGPTREIQRVQTEYELPSTKLMQIFNPTDLFAGHDADPTKTRQGLDIPACARVVAWHGRVSIEHKGLDTLLTAWKHVSVGRPDVILLLVGTGPDAKRLNEQIRSMRLDNIRWVNEYVLNRDTLRSYLSAGDIYAFSSRHEGFPVAPIEAMACGLPLVATDVNGVRDILQGGEDSGGVIVPPDDPILFAGALGRLLDDEAYRRKLGANAQHRAATHFSIEAVGDQLQSYLFPD